VTVPAELRAGRADDVESCVAVLAALPDFFTPNTHAQVREQMAGGARLWVATDGGGPVIGFVLVEQRYPASAEITFAAVLHKWRGRGVGTALVEAAMSELATADVAVVLVKTLDASAGYEPYVATRAFWAARGFHQIDCIDPLPGWEPGSPAALLVAPPRRQ
jgi:ribosomal protein S18 acetylase RimI-like enzyme